MEYVYASLFLHQVGKEISEENLKKLFEAVGAQYDEVRVKAVVAALKEVNIDEILSSASLPVVAPAAAAPTTAQQAPAAPSEKPAEEKKEEEKKEEVSEEALATGLSALFA